MQMLLEFEIVDQSYALALSEVVEIVPQATLSRPPDAPPVLEGFLNLAGQSIAVVRLDLLLHAKEFRPSLYTPIVILKCSRPRIGLLVERVHQVLRVSEDEILPVGHGESFNDSTTGIVRPPGRGAILILNSERLVLERERQYLAEFEANHKDRLRRFDEARRS